MQFSLNRHPSLGLHLKIRRLLTRQEKADKLKLDERQEVVPHYWGSLIKLNSDYLELIDINYQRKGFAFVVVVVLLCFILLPTFGLYSMITGHGYEFSDYSGTYIFAFLILIFFYGIIAYLLFQEAFTYTHCPVRLNRKTRMVHVFRRNGTILSVPWNEVHFVLTQTRWMGIPKAYIAAHVLDESRQIIQETFVLGGYLTSRPEIALSLWEFFRHYMEVGPEFAVRDELLYCLPIDKNKESFDLGDTLIRFSKWIPGTPPLSDFMSIILFFESLARWISTMTCRIPKWPQEIEDVCKIEPGDPFVRDGSTNNVRASLAPKELEFR